MPGPDAVGAAASTDVGGLFGAVTYEVIVLVAVVPVPPVAQPAVTNPAAMTAIPTHFIGRSIRSGTAVQQRNDRKVGSPLRLQAAEDGQALGAGTHKVTQPPPWVLMSLRLGIGSGGQMAASSTPVK